jgi:hypothetical protein
MSLAATGLLLVAGVMTWSNENSTVVDRNNEYFATTYAAEAATEKALCAMVQDDQDYGEGIVFTQTSTYAGLIPTASDNSYWTNYQFSGGSTSNRLVVTQISASSTNVLGPPYQGLISVGATYDIIANARNKSSMYNLTSTVGQKINFGQIPIFQFAIFYQDTMEIDPGANMNVTGLVHGNTNIFLDPNSGVTLNFFGDVSASGVIDLFKNPLDPSSRSATATGVNFTGTNHISNVNPLNLPIGTNISGTATNIAQNVLSILQVPPAGESPNSPAGTNRFYNQVDLIVTITNGNVITVTSGVDINGQATVISNNQWSKFVSTNGSFYDGRNGITVNPVDIDVGNLRQWSLTNTVLRPTLISVRSSTLADVSSVYVVDQRTLSNAVIITNISYTTNTTTTTTAGYPTAGTYVAPVATNTLPTTSASYPTAGTFVTPPAVSTNSTGVTVSGYASHPTAGTYTVPPGITTNTVATNSTSSPPAGSYTGTPVHSGGTYHYNYITGYTYNLITGYIYTGITGFTYGLITSVTTNISYTTNWAQFAMPGVVLTNGAVIPPNGLSIATPDPAYIVGNWNVQTNTGGTSVAGTSNVNYTLPSAVYADAITVLSPSWNPANNTVGSGNLKTASTDTVNAAFLTGNVPSNSSYYSGGVENFPRFLENWSNQNLYYNGSMVEMFPSQIANSPWPGTGTIYNPPTRNWTFDTNFQDPSKLPPLTPKVIYLQRSQWSSLSPGTTSF